LALLAVSLGAPAAAQAGCAHYVTSRSQVANRAAQLELLSLADALTSVGAEIPTNQPQPSKPCTGAMCSGNPAIPLVPASSEAPRNSQWAVCEFAAPAQMWGLRASLLPDPLGRPAPVICSIFHPPRSHQPIAAS
jgi:hypothetical protein